MRQLLLFGFMSLIAGCYYAVDVEMGDVGPGGLGATPGGAQDIGYARAVIAQGGVPTSDQIPVEGLLSEHDLPTLGPPCEDLLCVRPALGVAPSLALGADAHWVQLGLTSGLPSPFQRPPLDLVVVIDHSSSMAIDMHQVEEAVSRLIAKMRPDDRLAVLAFNDRLTTLHPLEAVADPARLEADVRALNATGGWSLQPAMQAAYDLHGAVGDDPTRLRRVALLTCAYPGVSNQFSGLLAEGADERIGLSMFGVLLGYNSGLAGLLGRTRGGSFSYLESLEKVEQVFDVDFDTMMSPLAYDLSLSLSLGDRFTVDRVYGIPGDDEGAPRTELEVTTAFVSRRKGAIIARLLPLDALEAGEQVGEARLSYDPEPAHGWPAASEVTSAILHPEPSIDGGASFESLGVRKAVALVNQAEQLRAACDAWHAGEHAEARETVAALLVYLETEAVEIGDGALDIEVALVARLLENMG